MICQSGYRDNGWKKQNPRKIQAGKRKKNEKNMKRKEKKILLFSLLLFSQWHWNHLKIMF